MEDAEYHKTVAFAALALVLAIAIWLCWKAHRRYFVAYDQIMTDVTWRATLEKEIDQLRKVPGHGSQPGIRGQPTSAVREDETTVVLTTGEGPQRRERADQLSSIEAHRPGTDVPFSRRGSAQRRHQLSGRSLNFDCQEEAP